MWQLSKEQHLIILFITYRTVKTNKHTPKHKFWSASIRTQTALFFPLNTREQLNIYTLVTPPSNSWVLAHELSPLWSRHKGRMFLVSEPACGLYLLHPQQGLSWVGTTQQVGTHREAHACWQAAVLPWDRWQRGCPSRDTYTRAGWHKAQPPRAVNIRDPRQGLKLPLAVWTGTWQEWQPDRVCK